MYRPFRAKSPTCVSRNDEEEYAVVLVEHLGATVTSFYLTDLFFLVLLLVHRHQESVLSLLVNPVQDRCAPIFRQDQQGRRLGRRHVVNVLCRRHLGESTFLHLDCNHSHLGLVLRRADAGGHSLPSHVPISPDVSLVRKKGHLDSWEAGRSMCEDVV